MAERGTVTHWWDTSGAAKFLPSRLRSLRFRILIWALPALMILLFAVLLVDIFAYQWVMVFVAEQRAQEIAETSAARLAHQFHQQAQRLTSVASLPYIRFGDSSSQALALAEAMADIPEFLGDGVSLLDEQGMVVTSQPWRSDLQALDLHTRPYFQALLTEGGPFFSDVIRDEENDRPMVVVAVPVQGLEGQIGGVLVARFYLDGTILPSMVPRLGIEPADRVRSGTDRLDQGGYTTSGGNIYVLDRTGRVIHHPEERLVNQRLPPESSLTKAVMQEGTGSRLLALPNDDPQVVGYATVPDVGWRLVVQEPWEATIAPLRTYLWLGSGALLSGVILSIVAILWGARRIGIPVDNLVQQAEKAIQSNYRTRMQSESITELQRLATAFNRMIEQIERYRAGLRRYVAAITYSQEEERRRVARELHDDTIQSLVAISRRLELIQVSLSERTPPDLRRAQQQLTDLQDLLQGTIEGVRRFSRELRPTLLEDLGLIPALRQLMKEMTSEGVEVVLRAEGDSQDMDPDVELALYRIAQEAMNNVRRHARAHHVELRLDRKSDLIHFVVEDDGQGFEVVGSLNELAQRGSFGLMGIQERVELLGGQIAIESQVGHGTRIEVWLPRSGDPSTARLSPSA